jgi:hypothetical protein
MKDTYRNLFNTYGNTKEYKKMVKFVNRLNEQKKNLDPNKKYILDPFVGYIEKK